MQEPFSKHRRPEFKENSWLRFEMRVTGCKIRKCGWRLLHKKDYLEDLQMLNNGGLVLAPSDSGHSDGMNKSSVDESKGEDATAL
ncbi:TIR-NBS-LRR resistance protein, partial [Trifolium medium]|nr:TIR-NBS-LRR resistance protein [Trifolium medium]